MNPICLESESSGECFQNIYGHTPLCQTKNGTLDR